jgi:hypothetical protein
LANSRSKLSVTDFHRSSSNFACSSILLSSNWVWIEGLGGDVVLTPQAEWT